MSSLFMQKAEIDLIACDGWAQMDPGIRNMKESWRWPWAVAGRDPWFWWDVDAIFHIIVQTWRSHEEKQHLIGCFFRLWRWTRGCQRNQSELEIGRGCSTPGIAHLGDRKLRSRFMSNLQLEWLLVQLQQFLVEESVFWPELLQSSCIFISPVKGEMMCSSHTLVITVFRYVLMLKPSVFLYIYSWAISRLIKNFSSYLADVPVIKSKKLGKQQKLTIINCCVRKIHGR